MYIKVIIIFFVLILIYKILLYYRDNFLIKKCITKNRYIHLKLLNLLKELTPLLELKKIDYCIIDGTLLGHQRHNKKFILWDDDIDIGLFNNEGDLKEKIEQINFRLSMKGIKIFPVYLGYKISYIDNQDNFSIDLYDYKLEGDKYIHKSFQTRMIWPNNYFYKDELYPLKKDIFEGVDVYIPNNINKYLCRVYGLNCLTEMQFTTYHDANFFDKLIIILTQRSKLKTDIISKYY